MHAVNESLDMYIRVCNAVVILFDNVKGNSVTVESCHMNFQSFKYPTKMGQKLNFKGFTYQVYVSTLYYYYYYYWVMKLNGFINDSLKVLDKHSKCYINLVWMCSSRKISPP